MTALSLASPRLARTWLHTAVAVGGAAADGAKVIGGTAADGAKAAGDTAVKGVKAIGSGAGKLFKSAADLVLGGEDQPEETPEE